MYKWKISEEKPEAQKYISIDPLDDEPPRGHHLESKTSFTQTYKCEHPNANINQIRLKLIRQFWTDCEVTFKDITINLILNSHSNLKMTNEALKSEDFDEIPHSPLIKPAHSFSGLEVKQALKLLDIINNRLCPFDQAIFDDLIKIFFYLKDIEAVCLVYVQFSHFNTNH